MHLSRRVCPAALLRVAALACALVPPLVFAAEPAAARSPAAPAGPPAQKAPPNRDFWAASFNAAEKFANRGVEGYRHATLTSRKLRFKGVAEMEVGYTIYLPPGYERSDTRYPIVYFLAGNGDSEEGSAGMVRLAHELIVKGEIPPFVIAGITGGRSFYGNQFEGRCQVYDFFFEEFLPHIEQTYRVKTEARYRHLQGMSAGGNGALLYAVKRPELFGTVTTVAGAFNGVRVNAWAQMYDAREANFRPYDPYVLIPQNQARLGHLRLALWVGSEDTTRGDNARMHQFLAARGIPHAYHDWNSDLRLQGVTHSFAAYYAAYGREILQFHAAAFGL